MKKLKIFTSIAILFLVGIAVVLGYLLTSISYEKYEEVATVIERRSATELVVELDEEPEQKIKNELIVYSNIFAIGDKINIEYSKIGSKYVVNRVSILESNEKTYIASRITIDPTIIKYRNIISGKIDRELSSSLNSIIAMPVKLKNQEFNLIEPKEYFEMYYYNMNINFILVPENTEAKITLLKDFKVVSLENIDEDVITNLEYNYINKSITFKGLGKGIYSLKLSFENGDIINYIFV